MPVRGVRRTTAWSVVSPRALAISAVLLVLVVAAAAVGLVTIDRDTTPDARPPSTSASTVVPNALPAGALAWLDRSLPHDAVVLADRDAATALASKGFSPVLPGAAAGIRLQFVVSTPMLRATAGSDPTVAAAIRGSVPVAVVPADGHTISVRQVATVSAAAMSDDADTRRQAEQQLLANPSVRADPPAAAVLRAGGLDLRAATVLALIATGQAVEIVSIDAAPAERAAGRPARSLVLRVDSITDVRYQLDVVSSRYRVASVQTQVDGTVRLVWPVDVTPVTGPN